MKKLIAKLVMLAIVVYSVVAGINYFIDPANIYHEGTVNRLVDCLNGNNIVEVPANVDEGVFQEKRITTLAGSQRR